MGLVDLEKHFAFYGAYHSNPVNVWIHMLLVGPLCFTMLMQFYYVPIIFSPNFSMFFSVVYGVFCVCMEIKAGLFAALLWLLASFGASACADFLGYSLTWKIVLASQLLGWAAQLIGHGVYEKRAPALLHNYGQAFVMAPFFVLLEVLRCICGYEPYPGFYDKVKVLVDADVKDWKEQSMKKSS